MREKQWLLIKNVLTITSVITLHYRRPRKLRKIWLCTQKSVKSSEYTHNIGPSSKRVESVITPNGEACRAGGRALAARARTLFREMPATLLNERTHRVRTHKHPSLNIVFISLSYSLIGRASCNIIIVKKNFDLKDINILETFREFSWKITNFALYCNFF